MRGFSGFKKNNPLSKCGNVNFHISSDQYNFIEMSHHIILVYLVFPHFFRELKLYDLVATVSLMFRVQFHL